MCACASLCKCLCVSACACVFIHACVCAFLHMSECLCAYALPRLLRFVASNFPFFSVLLTDYLSSTQAALIPTIPPSMLFYLFLLLLVLLLSSVYLPIGLPEQASCVHCYRVSWKIITQILHSGNSYKAQWIICTRTDRSGIAIEIML